MIWQAGEKAPVSINKKSAHMPLWWSPGSLSMETKYQIILTDEIIWGMQVETEHHISFKTVAREACLSEPPTLLKHFEHLSHPWPPLFQNRSENWRQHLWAYCSLYGKIFMIKTASSLDFWPLISCTQKIFWETLKDGHGSTGPVLAE